MSNIGKGIATFAVFGGTALLAYVFQKAGVLSGEGAGWMTVLAFVTVGALWIFAD